ncbi:hypothetical protein FQR65_LT03510 [Abscondita terminalis]|nr:hypothetical protein FQR65_LT03510 [Abscondita terminalis]
MEEICRICLITITNDATFYCLSNDTILKTQLLDFCPEIDLSITENPVLCDQCTIVIDQIHQFKQLCVQNESTLKNRILHESNDEQEPLKEEEFVEKYTKIEDDILENERLVSTFVKEETDTEYVKNDCILMNADISCIEESITENFYYCYECNYSTNGRQNLIEHILYHGFKCNKCSYSAFNNSLLTAHNEVCSKVIETEDDSEGDISEMPYTEDGCETSRTENCFEFEILNEDRSTICSSYGTNRRQNLIDHIFAQCSYCYQRIYKTYNKSLLTGHNEVRSDIIRNSEMPYTEVGAEISCTENGFKVPRTEDNFEVPVEDHRVAGMDSSEIPHNLKYPLKTTCCWNDSSEIPRKADNSEMPCNENGSEVSCTEDNFEVPVEDHRVAGMDSSEIPRKADNSEMPCNENGSEVSCTEDNFEVPVEDHRVAGMDSSEIPRKADNSEMPCNENGSEVSCTEDNFEVPVEDHRVAGMDSSEIPCKADNSEMPCTENGSEIPCATNNFEILFEDHHGAGKETPCTKSTEYGEDTSRKETLTAHNELCSIVIREKNSSEDGVEVSDNEYTQDGSEMFHTEDDTEIAEEEEFTHQNIFYFCHQCNYSTINKQDLTNHIFTHIFKCDQCDYTTSNDSLLTAHNLLHSNIHPKNFSLNKKKVEVPSQKLQRKKRKMNSEKCTKDGSESEIIKCGECDYSTSKKSNLSRHFIAMHKYNGKQYKCDLCEYGTTDKRLLICHINRHTNKIPYKCKLCDYTCRNLRTLKGHSYKHSGKWPYECDKCGYKTITKYNITIHIQTHTNKKTYNGNLCDYSSNDLHDLNSHLYKHTGDLNKKKVEVPSQKRQRKKRKITSEKLPCTKDGSESEIKCSKCDYSTSNKSNLSRHFISMHKYNGKQFKCELCKYGTSDKRLLISHINKHTNKMPFKCKLCDYTCRHLKTLKAHSYKHSGKWPYECDKCDYKTITKYKITKHIRTHTNEKPYNCNLCDYSSNHLHDLKSHLYKHTGDYPFKCNICGYKTDGKYKYRMHLKVHAGEKPYSRKNPI